MNQNTKRILVSTIVSVAMTACSTPSPSSGATYPTPSPSSGAAIPTEGVEPILSQDGKTVTYGLYPQTKVDDTWLIWKLDSLSETGPNGWYLYNGAFYAKQIARPFFSDCVFDDGSSIVDGTTYWFKCEPIVWNVLSHGDDTYYVLSSVLLDAHRYDGNHSNNYTNSEIRAWLNGDFYDSAFSLNDSHIVTTTVDNSATTTDSPANPYVSDDTQDKVYLLSYKDYHNSAYGFSTSTDFTSTRYCKTTDWARARGAWYSTSSGDTQLNGYYWTRSPWSYDSHYARSVYSDGSLDTHFCYVGGDAYRVGSSVRPSLSLKLS